MKKKKAEIIKTILFFIFPIFSIQMVECLNNIFIYDFRVLTFIVNYMFYLLFYLIIFVLVGKYHVTILIANIMLFIWAVANYYIELFRATPFVPMDIVCIGTGLNVAAGYTFSLSWQIIVGLVLCILICIFGFKLKNAKPAKRKTTLLIRLLPIIYIVAFLSIFLKTDALANIGYKPDFWNQSRGYHKTGSFMNFCLNLKYLTVSEPPSYDASNVEQLLNARLKEAGVDPESDTSINILTGENDYKASTDGKYPNIIYIMNESLADLGALGELETNVEYMSFMHGLTENTIKGYLSMPVFGAGTSNSEFEALTGNSYSFLPIGSNVYQTFIHDSIPSLVSTLGTLGYTETAFHPYYANGWNRTKVYDYLGFERFYSIEDLIGKEILDNYRINKDSNAFENIIESKYPYQNMLLRGFISDEYDYKQVISKFIARDHDVPYFMFNVTMQNHGGYTKSHDNFQEAVEIMNLRGRYHKANRYLSLVRKSDKAFEKLINYFSSISDPTIVCMFGDHFPSIEDEFYEEIMGTTIEEMTVEQQQKRYSTPFIIWANYDIPEAEIENISANYLSTLLSQVAGLPMTKYNKYLSAIYQQLPVINTVGYIDNKGKQFELGEKSEYSDLLNEYYCIEYNGLFDKENRVDSLFYLDKKFKKY